MRRLGGHIPYPANAMPEALDGAMAHRLPQPRHGGAWCAAALAFRSYQVNQRLWKQYTLAAVLACCSGTAAIAQSAYPDSRTPGDSTEPARRAPNVDNRSGTGSDATRDNNKDFNALPPTSAGSAASDASHGQPRRKHHSMRAKKHRTSGNDPTNADRIKGVDGVNNSPARAASDAVDGSNRGGNMDSRGASAPGSGSTTR